MFTVLLKKMLILKLAHRNNMNAINTSYIYYLTNNRSAFMKIVYISKNKLCRVFNFTFS